MSLNAYMMPKHPTVMIPQDYYTSLQLWKVIIVTIVLFSVATMVRQTAELPCSQYKVIYYKCMIAHI